MYNKRIVFWSACLGMLQFGITLIVLGSIAPGLKEKLQLNEIETGTLFSILPLGILAGSLMFGPVADKYGYKLLMVVSCFLSGAGFEGIALTGSEDFLKACIFIIGLSGGVINGATNALVSDISDNNKIADISLLGVFFGIGALGMPLILGTLGNRIRFEEIVSGVGSVSFAVGIIFGVIRLPSPKVTEKIPVGKIVSFFKDKGLLLIAFFLFFQSSFEGIMNNWTTSYLGDHAGVSEEVALFGLTFFVSGMVIMRLITGTVLRSLSVNSVLFASFVLISAGLILIKAGSSDLILLSGFMIVGAGLASGFPVMLGFVGERYPDISGTAFSFVLTIALTGNMLVNFFMGIIAEQYGIAKLLLVASAELLLLAASGTAILLTLNKQRITDNKSIHKL
jgi:fucose permease